MRHPNPASPLSDRVQPFRAGRFTGLLALVLLSVLAARPGAAPDPFNFADFDDGFNANNLNGSWYYWDDTEGGGESRILSGDTSFKPTEFSDSSLAPGQGGSAHSAMMTFVYGAKKPACGTGCTYDQEVGLGSDMRTGIDTAADLRGATHVSFWVKGSVAMKARFIASTADITDYAFYGAAISITTEWKEITIDLKNASQFAQPSWAAPKTAFNAAKVTGLEFSFSKADNPSLAGGTFFLDGVKIHNWSIPDDPVAVRRSPAVSAAPRILSVQPDGLWRVGLPDLALHAPGTLKAFTPDGRLLAMSRFAAGQASVLLDLHGRMAQGVRFQISSAP